MRVSIHLALLKGRGLCTNVLPTNTRLRQLLFNVAALRGGYDIEDGKTFASLVTDLMAKE